MRLASAAGSALMLLALAGGCGPPSERGQQRVPVALKRDGASAFDGVRPGEVVNVTGTLEAASAGAGGAAGEAALSEAGVRAVFAMRKGQGVRPELVGRVVTIRATYEGEEGGAHRLLDGRVVVPDP